MPATVPAKDPESPSIVEFISARLDEDEAAALPFGHTTWRDEETPIGVILVDGEALIEGHITGLTAHIARHDPARVLAEVKAWRRLLLESSLKGVDAVYAGTERETGFHLALSFALKCKYMSYSDHPDYREELLSAPGVTQNGQPRV